MPIHDERDVLARATEATELPIGACYDLVFPLFTIRLRLDSASRLTFEVVEGFDMGRRETAEYQAVCLRPGLFILSFQEDNGECVVDVQDFEHRVVHTHLMLEDDRFVRMTGTMREAHGSLD